MNNPFDFKYGLMAVDMHIRDNDFNNPEIVHFIGFEMPPTDIDKEEISKELKSDETFGLTNTQFVVMEAPKELVDIVKETIYKMKAEGTLKEIAPADPNKDPTS